MSSFMSGAIFMGCLTCSFFFFRFWKKSLDRFFLFFSLAFLILAAERLVLEIISLGNEGRPYVYIMRLSAFSIIALGILLKNLGKI